MTDSSHPSDTAARPGGSFTLAGREVARVGYGTMQLPRATDPDAACAVLRRAYELGVNHFDTAHFYGDGTANRYLAATLAVDPDVVVVTKVGARPARRGPMPLVPAQRPEQLRAQVHANLRSLAVERLDVVNMRRIPPGSFPLTPSQRVSFDDQMAEMIALREEGLIGHIGVSTVDTAELRAALPAGIVCVSNQYSLTSRKQEPVLDVARAEGIAWVPYFPLGGAMPGLAKVTHEPVVQRIAQEAGATPAQIGLAWLLHRAPNVLIIPGTTSIAHLEQNVAAGSITLDADQIARLDAVEPATGVRGFLGRLRRP
ncbi:MULTISPECIES: aldo/keto reductase [Nocardia]|uniref:Putative oxidoreductase YdbC n=1 Tax=Nocardia farcinica TaxID=37329 RepID=A0A0H5NGY8_NOCFR|nr:MULTISPECIES: aldo/keto reductase [Nocardia]SLH26390.1 oxidoreductase YdbC [Mycobacteroides abscessus subsp. abscessus]AXK84256.1 aldo/keto reductase [Nocardia farcinica]MBA4858490.1 aldo/keto reductase [Nocardia farcinica]MBC9819161.1 aldo/keto reductase [Nocardia farcinica]MBF6143137.1 aldo/keto reductase [Nocardia farcinica]